MDERSTQSSNHQLFCFPYAGSGASIFRAWNGLLGATRVEPMALPGHAEYLSQPLEVNFDRLLRRMTDEVLRKSSGGPFSLFGYSMGALLAFEIAHALQRQHAPLPVALFLAASRPPHCLDCSEALSLLDDEALVAAIGARFQPLPPQALAHPDHRRLFLRIIRADFAALESYEFVPGPKLSLPLFILAGEFDPLTPQPMLERWAELTTGPVVRHFLPGDHFFIRTHAAQLLAFLRTNLERLSASFKAPPGSSSKR